jgi:hypothetical protein
MPLGLGYRNASAALQVRSRCGMEYRGKNYSVVQSLERNWKWSIDFEGQIKSGKAQSRQAGIKEAEREIDRALAPKKKRPVLPAR